MAMTDEEVLTHYNVKLDMVREQGGTEMQLRMKAENNEVHPERPLQ